MEEHTGKTADALIRMSCGCFYVQRVARGISTARGEARNGGNCRLCGGRGVTMVDIMVLQIEDAEKWR